MPKLAEIAINNPDFKRRASKVNRELTKYAEKRMDAGLGESSYYYMPAKGWKGYSADQIMEISESALQVVHEVMWQQGQRDKWAPMVRVYHNGNFRKNTIQQVFELYDDSGEAASKLGRQILENLRLTGRIRNRGKAKKGAVDVVVFDPANSYPPLAKVLGVGSNLSTRSKQEVEQQAQKAVVLASDVNSKYDIDLIPTPDPNPESVMEYIKKMRKAAHGMAGRIDALEKALTEANAKLDEYADAIESAKAADEWGKVVQAIEDEKAR
jgi:hypothetical protein